MGGIIEGGYRSGMRCSDLPPVSEQAARPAAPAGPWTVRPPIAGAGIFAAVLTLDIVLKSWAQESLAEPVCLASWMCLAVQHNPGLFLGMVALTPESAVSVAHWLALPPALAWLGWRLLTPGQHAGDRLLRTGGRRSGRQSCGSCRGSGDRLCRVRSDHRRTMGVREPRGFRAGGRRGLAGGVALAPPQAEAVLAGACVRECMTGSARLAIGEPHPHSASRPPDRPGSGALPVAPSRTRRAGGETDEIPCLSSRPRVPLGRRVAGKSSSVNRLFRSPDHHRFQAAFLIHCVHVIP